MLKTVFIITFLILTFNKAAGQVSDSETEPYYINLFIKADKTIYLEKDQIKFFEIEKKVFNIIRKRPFNFDQAIVYRIFADENLDMGYIIDVNQKLISAFNDNVKTERYLLNSLELKIDGQNWLESLNIKELEEI